MLKMNDTEENMIQLKENMRVSWGRAFIELSYYEHVHTCTSLLDYERLYLVCGQQQRNAMAEEY